MNVGHFPERTQNTYNHYDVLRRNNNNNNNNNLSLLLYKERAAYFYPKMLCKLPPHNVGSVCLFESTTLIKHIFNFNYNEDFRILGCAVKYVQNERNLSVLKNSSPETESHAEKFLPFDINRMEHGKYLI